MASRDSDFMWADKRFWNYCKSRVIRDEDVRRQIKQQNPDAEVFGSFAEASGWVYEKFIIGNNPKKSNTKKRKR
jgi:hypothetical protein